MLEEGVVNPIVRVLLWTAVILAPGGVVLLPLLAADAMKTRQRTEGAVVPLPATEAPAVST